MNKQFKERLTGAVILVVFLVLVVPALLSGPPRSVAPAAPAAGEGPPMRSYTIDLTAPAGAQPPMTLAPAPVPVPAPEPEPAPAPTPPPAVAESQAAPAAEPAAEPDAPPAAGFAVQIGSFASRANADGLVAKLRMAGHAAFISPTDGARKLYRVRVGPVADQAAAERLAGQLAAAGQKGKIVSLP
ncbi:MAG: SPOR domain-containing protein [Steroidobacteraceae bacterium]